MAKQNPKEKKASCNAPSENSPEAEKETLGETDHTYPRMTNTEEDKASLEAFEILAAMDPMEGALTVARWLRGEPCLLSYPECQRRIELAKSAGIPPTAIAIFTSSEILGYSLPPWIRMELNRKGAFVIRDGGIHVLGSLCIDRHVTKPLPGILSIGGDLRFSEVPSTVVLPDLKQVGGSVWAESTVRLKLPSLECVHGSLNLNNAAEAEFSSLSYIGNSVSAMWTKGLQIPALKHIKGSLLLERSFDADFSSLTELNGNLILTKSSNALFPKLQRIGLNLRAEFMMELWLPELNWIGGKLDTVGTNNIITPLLKMIDGKNYSTRGYLIESPDHE